MTSARQRPAERAQARTSTALGGRSWLRPRGLVSKPGDCEQVIWPSELQPLTDPVGTARTSPGPSAVGVQGQTKQTLHVDTWVVSHMGSFSPRPAPCHSGRHAPVAREGGSLVTAGCQNPDGATLSPVGARPTPRGPGSLPRVPTWSRECGAHSWPSEGKANPPPPLTHLASGGGVERK